MSNIFNNKNKDKNTEQEIILGNAEIQRNCEEKEGKKNG